MKHFLIGACDQEYIYVYRCLLNCAHKQITVQINEDLFLNIFFEHEFGKFERKIYKAIE
jgi:hypothetical protein